MRRLTLAITAILASLTSVFAISNPEEAFFIYRNDNKFDAFYQTRVDSITFSTFDLEGVEHDHYVTQEIWVADSVNRIPLEVIDKVGFVQPETKVNTDVFPLTVLHSSYMLETDTLSFVMDMSTPEGLRPTRGNVVVAEPECIAFPNGIMARVKSVSIIPEGYYYTCEAASLDDIYDQIVFYGTGTVAVPEDDEDNTPEAAQRRINLERNLEIWNKDFDGSIPKLQGSKYHANDKASCEIKICKTLGSPLYAEIKVTNALTSDVSYALSVEKEFKPDSIQIGKTLKVGRISFPHPLLSNFIWLEPQISLYGYFEAKGELDVDFAAHFNRTDVVSLVYSDKKWSINHTPTMDAGVDAAKISMKGSVEAGLIPEILFALNGSATGIGIKARVGVKQTLDFKFDAVQCYEDGVYDAIKDIQTDTYLTYSTSIFVQSGLFDKDAPRKSYELLNRQKRLFSKYVFPVFGAGSCQLTPERAQKVTLRTDRDVILPLKLGMRLYDDNGNFLQEASDVYDYNKNVKSYSFTFPGLDIVKTYKAYPVIRLGDFAVQANPSVTVNRCPARIFASRCEYTYYDRQNANYPNRMVFSIDAALEDDTAVTEWGVAIDDETLIPFEEIDAEQEMWLGTGVPAGSAVGLDYRLDFNSWNYEIDETYRAYVKRTDANGNEAVMFSEPFSTTLRYDTPPSMKYSNAKLAATDLITTSTDQYGNTIRQYRSIATYTMALLGAFWLDYIDGGVDKAEYTLVSNPQWRPTYDGEWDTQWETTYWNSNPDISHSNWHNLHLRETNTIVESDHLNWHGSGYSIQPVDITPSDGTCRALPRKAIAAEKPEFVSTSVMPVKKTQIKSFVPSTQGRKITQLN